MATIREKRIKARKLGITNARELSEDELDEAISDAKNGSGSKKKSTKAVKKAVKGKVKKRGPGRPRKDEVDDDEDDEPVTKKKRGRPKGSGKKKVVEETPKRRGRPPKEKTSTTKGKTKKNPVGRPVGSGTGTRILVPQRIKWNKKFDFRDGSQAQYILTALRKAAEKYDDTDDIREAVIEKLENKLNKIDELTFMNRETGKPHKGDKATSMLRFRVNHTIWKFVIETEQGDEAPAKKKKSSKAEVKSPKKRGRPRKVEDDDDDDDDEDEDDEPVKKKRGRPPGSGKKADKKQKRGPGRPKGSGKKKTDDDEEKPRRGRPPGSGKKKRGRPKGSKNKT